MLDFRSLARWALVCVFLAAAAAIAFAGTKIARFADTLADRTGMGEVIAGAIFVGASTSLAGAVTSVVAAFGGAPGIAIGNAFGGITAPVLPSAQGLAITSSGSPIVSRK